jgi:hypothetical protein
MVTTYGDPVAKGVPSRRRLCARALLVALGAVASFFATEARAEEPTADKAAAQALFDQAKEFIATGRIAEACPKLEESERLDPTSGTLINLADCYERQGRIASAWNTFVQAAGAAKAGGHFEREQVARARASAIAPRLSKIVIHVAAGAAHLELRRDGMSIDRSEWDSPIPVDLGEHRVRASAGNKTWEQVVSIKVEGETQTVEVPVLDVPVAVSTETATMGGQRIAAIGAGAVGVAGLVCGTAFGLKSMSKHSEADEHCVGSTCRDQTGVDLRADAKQAGNLSTAGFIVGALGMAGGAALWWTARDDANHAAGARIGIGLGNLALTATW